MADLNEGLLDLPRSRGRFVVFGIVAGLVVIGLAGRLFELQVLRGGEPRGRAAATGTTEVSVPAPRGLVFDREGRPLTVNVPSWTIAVRPADLPETARARVVARLAVLTGADRAALRNRIASWTGSPHDAVPLVSGVPREVALLVGEAQASLPGVLVEVEPVRRYLGETGKPDGALLSHVLGYTGPVTAQELETRRSVSYAPDDVIGKAGIEATYERELRGEPGVTLVERDPSGRLGDTLRVIEPPAAGRNLMLTIDARAQRLATQALSWGMDVAKVSQGVLIAMNPQNGEVLAMVSLPAYDNNAFAGGIDPATFDAYLADPGQPLRNHAIGDIYPPGSTYKLVTAIAALQEGVTDASRRWPTYGCYQIPGAPKGQCLYDWNRKGFGDIDVVDAFAVSSDTFFYQMAIAVGVDKLARWADELGFGAPSGIALPGEAAGVVASTAWAQEQGRSGVFTGELAQAGIGQNVIAATPMQVLNAYAALANGGTLMTPTVVRGEADEGGELTAAYDSRPIRTLAVSPGTLRTMSIGAREVITTGHAYNIRDLKLPGALSGKTGTAEFGQPRKDGSLPFHSWFVAYLPSKAGATDAQLAVVAFTYSAVVPGNVSAEVVKYWLQLWYGLDQDLRLDPRTFQLVGGN